MLSIKIKWSGELETNGWTEKKNNKNNGSKLNPPGQTNVQETWKDGYSWWVSMICNNGNSHNLFNNLNEYTCKLYTWMSDVYKNWKEPIEYKAAIKLPSGS